VPSSTSSIHFFRYGRWWLTSFLLLAAFFGGRMMLGTPSATLAAKKSAASASKTIDSIRVGQRVVADNPDVLSSAKTPSVSVDSATWRKLKLRAEWRWDDGTLDDVNVETLVPPEWIAQCKAQPGATVPLPVDLVEMGLPETLQAEVIANDPCPTISAGSGSVVLTTVNHLNPNVKKLILKDELGHKETVHPTGSHRFYSEDRRQWINANEIRQGEHLRSISGILTVDSIESMPGVHRVYNMTVNGEHVYHVTTLGLLAHNMCLGTSEETILWKAPQAGRDGASEILNGFSAETYVGEGAYFGVNENGLKIAKGFEYHYGNGLQEIHIQTSELKNLIDRGLVVFDGNYKKGYAIIVKPEGLKQFNEAISRGTANIFHLPGI
jgi:hypothetical protein